MCVDDCFSFRFTDPDKIQCNPVNKKCLCMKSANVDWVAANPNTDATVGDFLIPTH